MNRPWTRRGFLAGSGVALAAASVLTGCGLSRPALQPRTFVLSVPPAGAGSDGPEPGGVLLVRPVRVTPAMDSRAFIVRRGESEYVADPYNGFLISPGPMLTELVAAWIQGARLFRMVTTGGSQVPPSHALEMEVNELFADFRSATAPAAVISLNARLLHPLAGPPAQQLRWQRELRKSIPLEKAGPSELIAGWNRALEELLSILGPAFRTPPIPPTTPQA